MQQNPILVKRFRGDVLESFHRGVICIVDGQGDIIFSAGDVEQVCFPRSALKLFQVIPLLESGAAEAFGFTMEEIALMCGSHNGEAEHVRVAENILKKIGMGKDKLRCGAQMPTLPEDRNRMIKTDQQPEHIHNNCSGKHAGFLAYCAFMGYDLDSYLKPEHPMHQEIKRITAEMHECTEESMHTAMDGCSAPIFSLSVKSQAIAYKNLLNPEKFGPARQKACETIISAMTQYPYMVAGTKRYCTEMMSKCGTRIFGKTGADGVYSLGFIREKLGCTIKIDDGLMGPQYSVAQQLIEKTGIFSPEILAELHSYMETTVTNWNKFETGKEIANSEIFAPLCWPELVTSN